MSLTQQSSNDITDVSPTHLGDTPFVGKAQAMKAIALSLIAALALGGSALAAERASGPRCETIEAMKAREAKGAKFTPLTPGQFHFVAGLYVASPITPGGGLPPGNGALLIEDGGHSGVVWTRGKQACITTIVWDLERHLAIYAPMPLTNDLLALVKAIQTGKDEAVAPDDSKDELHL